MIKETAKKVLETFHLTDTAWQTLRYAEAHSGYQNRKIIQNYFSNPAIPKKLHIGCGGNLLPGWLNADYSPQSRDVFILDATQPFLFDAGTFDFIFSEHMIEHISYPNACKMLAECYRVLKPAGKIRISTPDLAFLVDLYRADKSELQRNYIKWSSETYAGVDIASDTFVINNFVRDWGHIFIYDEKTLRDSMAKAGFKNIIRRELRQSDDAGLCDLENEKRMPAGYIALETFTLEGTKT